MLEDKLLEEFRTEIREEADARRVNLEDGIQLPEELALSEVIISYLEEAGIVSGYDTCAHQDQTGHRPCRIIALSLNEDSTRLDLFTCQKLGIESTLPRAELGRLAGWAARFFEYSAKGDHDRFSQNPQALDAAKIIQRDLSTIEEVKIHILTDGWVRDKAVGSITILGRIVETEVWDLERLYRASGEEVTRDKIEIDFTKLIGRPLSCLEMKPRPAEYETYLLILPGKLVYDLFSQFGPGLFEFNVRSFLQTKGMVNRGIQKTIKDEPGRFLAYNNGLTATADEIEVCTWHGETVIKRIRGLQIVNGAQTTASIHRAVKTDKLNVDEVAVSMKLTLVPADHLDEFVPLIAKYANTQNPIQIADLSASDRFHREFESLSESVWPPGEETRWFYERARGAYQMARNLRGTTPARRRDFDRTFPRNQHFGKTDLAKFLMSWWGFPYIVSRGSQKNYSAFMFGLRERLGDEWEPERNFYKATIAKAILFKTTQSVVRRAKLQSYGANVVTYCIALLADRFEKSLNLEMIWESQEISPALESLLTSWVPEIHAEIVATAGSRNVTEWCKKEECWNELKTLELSTYEEIPDEFSDGNNDAKSESLSVAAPSDADLISTCISHDAPSWARVMAWATSTPEVEDFDRRVVHTLSGYAINGWAKAPSPKQAARGVRVLDAARAAGVIA